MKHLKEAWNNDSQVGEAGLRFPHHMYLKLTNTELMKIEEVVLIEMCSSLVVFMSKNPKYEPSYSIASFTEVHDIGAIRGLIDREMDIRSQIWEQIF